MFTKIDYEHAATLIRARTQHEPRLGLVLGSGLGTLADTFNERDVIANDAIPNWPRATVAGHSGQIVLGEWAGQTVIAQQGRAHFYEGHPMAAITFPIRVMRALGVETLILTNAAGGLNRDFAAGELMLIEDHINFLGLAGQNPLMGPNDEALGPRFVGMTQAYDRDLRQMARRIAAEKDLPLRRGVYAGVSGPMFETPAEIRMLRTLGADAVGMSTVHEVVVARHSGMRVLAISGITNLAIEDSDSDAETSHEEVLEAGKVIVPRLTALLESVLRAL